MTQKQYVRQILRRIRATDKTKRRIHTDLMADIAAKEEAGQTPEQIQAAMGSPEKVAAEFNASFADTDAAVWYRRQRIARTAAIVLAVLAGIAFLFSPGAQLAWLSLMEPGVGIIGGADGPTTVFVTGAAVTGEAGALEILLALYGLPLLLAALAAACLAAWLIFRSHRS